jgi:type I restriction enzyme M protein
MLDSTTKARIDSARDILVGKVPDPKSQVEQITIALIYKFMDDMDRQSEEVGGKASFFKGEFKKYRWSELLDKRLGGQQRLNLYAEGIEKMNGNKNIPQLFRDIFKGVFLPYRDPETLNLFLKEINGFTYDHSERLGDAYEYLLSVLGTQGDAGQFRTPRHIIDFIVRIVDPQKHETVLDPACGTAGFLISAYKRILATANAKSEIRNPKSELTPDERARLMTNFCGYDIAPDMVRLSRVNMYLHGFPSPVIHEYDALTSEERWDERYDVIMANPPFMTPKGGIRPHNRFSIPANRSEVLFVDYIAEHLNPGGRAGIIVPEGIIFQSQNAYKNLRRMLVENYRWAVVSLPAGVFNPYSGVKTSVLFLDRNLAKRTDEVLFVKIENDGFDLGAQRRPIEANDLPEAFETLLAWKTNQKGPNAEIAHAVARKRLLGPPDISLSGDRYRQVAVRGGNWPTAKLGELCNLEYGLTRSASDAGNARFIRITDISSDGTLLEQDAKFITLDNEAKEYLLRNGDVLVARTGATYGKTMVFQGDFPAVFASYLIRLRFSEGTLLPKFYWYFALSKKYWEQARKLASGGGQPQFNGNALKRIEIPLPPLAEQERLVAELEGHRKQIEKHRQEIAALEQKIQKRVASIWGE